MIYDTEINRPASIIISDSVNCNGCSTDIAVVAVSKGISLPSYRYPPFSHTDTDGRISYPVYIWSTIVPTEAFGI